MIDSNPYTAPNPQPVDDPPLMAQLSAEEGMTVEFEQTLEDVLTLQFLLARELGDTKMPRGLIVFIAAVALLMFAASALTASIDNQREEVLVGCVGAVVIAGVGVVSHFSFGTVTRWLLRMKVVKLVQKTHNRSLIGLRRVTISPQYVVWSSPATQNAARWTGVERVHVEQDCLYIFITAIDAIFLPRRAFNSEQHFREYALAAEQYRQQGTA